MKHILAFMLIATLVSAIVFSTLALNFTKSTVEVQRIETIQVQRLRTVKKVATEYHFTHQEVVDAIKLMIRNKYPDADVESDDCELSWHDGQPVSHDYTWSSEFQKTNPVITNAITFTVYRPAKLWE